MTARRAVRTRWWAAAAAAALACAATLLPAGERDGGAGGADPGEADGRAAAREVSRVLERRGRAVLDGDEKAFLATVDPTPGPFRLRQRTEFRNLDAMPLASWRYRLAGTDAYPLPEGGGSGRIAARVRLAYRIDGFDAAPVTATEYWTFARRGGHWVLTSDTDGDPAGRRGAVQVWEQAAMGVVHGRRSLVLGPGTPRALKAYAEEADRAVPAADRAWGGTWAGKVVVVVPDSLHRMAGLLDAPADAYRDIAAVTTSERGGAPAASADRIVVNPEAFGQLSALGRQVVMIHETTHVATRRSTTAATPLWLSEGFADWAAQRSAGLSPARAVPELREEVAAGRPPRALPFDEDFDTARDGLARQYGMAWLACRMIAERWGEKRLVEFYRAVGASAGGEDAVDAAMRATLRTGLADFTADWRTYVAEELT